MGQTPSSRNVKGPVRRTGLIDTPTVPSGTLPIHSAEPSTGPFIGSVTVSPVPVTKRISGRIGSSKKLAE
jgi:hypothetical protein